MSRIFRYGMTYAVVEHAQSLGYVCIDGKEEHIVNAKDCRSVLECKETLKKITGKENWKWIA